LGATWPGILTGQLISSASHYFADRRYPLRQLAARTGRLEFHDTNSGGELLDQSWHRCWLAVSAGHHDHRSTTHPRAEAD
jgi:hypothetical protein